MEINEFSDLSDFVVNEVDKASEVTGAAQPSKKLIKYMNNQIHKYAKLYSKPLYKAEKERIKLWRAINTMPHGFLWKMFHRDLWLKIQAELKKQEPQENQQKREEPQQVYYPVLVKEHSVPEVVEEDVE